MKNAPAITFTTKGKIDINFTSLQGYIDTSFYDLCQCFGEPNSEGDGYKVDAEWMMKFSDGTVATIYNWKNGKNYCGDDGEEVEDMTNWHIGGRNQKAVEYVQDAMKRYLDRTCVQAQAQIQG
jgi:hypothetical protein